MSYKFIRIQNGEGCDYTIGCGIQVDDLVATTVPEAIAEAKSIVWPDEPEYYNYDRDERLLDQGFLVKVVHELPVDDWQHEADEMRQARERAENDDTDRAEYERLKAKFGR